MNKELIISSNGHETAVAILEDDLVTEVFIERDRQRGTVGNIYKGRVSKVLPGMQSAFVDIGLERDAFLYVSEVYDTLEEFDRLDTDGDDDDKPEGDPANAEGDGDVNGNVDPEVAAKPQAPSRRNGRDRDRDRGPQPKIQDLLEQGQEVLVQVVKEPLGTKGARITSHASMPGRFLVFMPTVDHIGISRKIDSREERSRLRRIVREFKKEHNFTGGVIIRTAAGGRSEEDIVSDLTYFHQVWTGIRQRTESNKAPAVVYQEESLVAKLLRDFLTKDYTAIRIDNAEEYGRVVKLVERIMPDLVPRVHRYAKTFPIFDEYGVQDEIDKALRPKVWLKSGGYLVINHTEALVAIDVNTGRYVGARAGRLEDTIVKTNLEAVKEIVRQFRLRDLGGIIVLDLIDMEERKNRQKIFQVLEQELRRDRSPSKAVQVVDVGLIIVTRKRVKQTLERQLTDACPYCSGTGTIKSTPTICYEILAEVQKIRGDLNGHGVVLRVNPEIARALQAEERAVLRDLRIALGGELTLKPDPKLHHEQFDVMAL
ncbi:MAG: Rne/Rng family ribonuclease [Vicinamibacterales bacterium]|jgi:ribonuclease G|nr:Rne/Rng family ribonuclease [Acidobacteriota bacterium]MDP7471243.1 Rne/Rng family ribonuclease [Vicinamibacterales bacterium]MDP7672985.1 Rne/Rng family ribonuclease [Vicinamibacterales bacterium]HJO38270.1 Rne/Rng family ribonuclease [Vicinamibacterales bacterium]